MVELSIVPIKRDEGINVIIGQAHFIKSVEDIFEALVNAVPKIAFGLAFAEASGACKVRSEGSDAQLTKAAEEAVLALAAGHVFAVMLKDAYPINVLNAIKAVPEVCTIFCASANPLQVVVASTPQGRGVMGVIDGASPKGLESKEDIAWRHGFLRSIGYKK